MMVLIKRAIRIAMIIGSIYSLMNFFLSIISSFFQIALSAKRMAYSVSFLLITHYSIIPLFQYFTLYAWLYVFCDFFIDFRFSIFHKRPFFPRFINPFEIDFN